MQRLQIRDQVGELFRVEVAYDAEGHHRDFLLDAIFDFVLMKFMRDTGRVPQGDCFGAFKGDEARVDLAVVHREGPSVEALGKFLTRLQDGFKQLGSFVAFADIDQVWPFRLLAVGERVAVDAGLLLEQQEAFCRVAGSCCGSLNDDVNG